MTTETTSETLVAARPDQPIPYERLGRPITGPRALGDSWTRFWYLAYNIALINWKMRFFGSVLGYLWQLVRPLLLFGVLYVFFTVITHVGTAGPSGNYYGTQLLGSIVLFTFFSEATNGAVRGVVENEALVRKIRFPRLVIPVSTVMFSSFNLALNLVVVLIFGLAQGVRPMVTWLELPLIIGMLGLLATGIAMLLSALFVYFRDVQPIWDVVGQVLFYASPVIIPLATVKAKLGPTLTHVYMASPLAVVLQQFRHAMVNNAAESAGGALGSQAMLAIPIAITLFIFGLGFWVFNRTAPLVAEDL